MCSIICFIISGACPVILIFPFKIFALFVTAENRFLWVVMAPSRNPFNHRMNWPTALDDTKCSTSIESLPVEDRGLPWHQALSDGTSELVVRLKERRALWDGGDNTSVLDDSSCSCSSKAASSEPVLRETMVRVARWSGSESKAEAEAEAAAPKSVGRSGTEASTRDPRSKPHVEEWLRQQQELTSSQLTSTTTFSSKWLAWRSYKENQIICINVGFARLHFGRAEMK